MENYGLVSIITPNWNCGKFIAKTIESVQAQTYLNWEMIIQDDCSSDDSIIVAKRYANQDPRIKLEVNPKNSGAATSRNLALQRAKGRWIAFLDSDDIWLPKKLELQLKFMIDNGYAFSYHDYEEISEEDKLLGIYISGPDRINKRGMYNYCWPGCLTVMYDTERIGLIQIEDIKKNNDYALWLEVIEYASCHRLDSSLSRYRRRKGSISNHSYTNLIKWHYKLFKEAKHFNAIKSIVLTFNNLAWGIYKKIHYVKHSKQNGG